MRTDGVTLQILSNHCRSAAESMAYNLSRTAYSTFLKETQDFSTGLTTLAGEMFATPIGLGTTWYVGLNYGGVLRLIENYDEGDICLTNDPYSGAVCTHAPDFHLWKPVFHGGEIVCFVVGHIHNTDIGGAVPGSLSRSLTDVHQEGFRLRPTKLYRKGELNGELVDIIRTNVRAPQQNWGDLKALVTALHTGSRKVETMLTKFGASAFRQGVEDILDYAERQARELIRSMPDGEYSFVDYVDEDTIGGNPCRICLKLTISGSNVILDFTGSDPQVESSLNVPTGGDSRHALLLIGFIYVLYSLDPSILLNAGLTRTCHCVLPSGTVVHPEFPAAVGLRSLTVVRITTIIMAAFAQAIPDRLPAGPASGGPIVSVSSFDERSNRRVVASIATIAGGAGGDPSGDGADGSGAIQSALSNTPVEINEIEVPIRITRYGLAKDSGGAGFHRGGLGSEIEFTALSPNTIVTTRNLDRTRFASWGLHGGKAGACSRYVLNPGTSTELLLGSKDIVALQPGEAVRITSDGAGGWGDPLKRPAEQVLRDVVRGFVSAEAAEQDYGVVVKDGEVDAQATAQLRSLAAPSEKSERYHFGPARTAFEAVWNTANYDALTEALRKAPVHWRFFIKTRIFEHMRNRPEPPRQDGSDVYIAMADILERYPQLRMSYRSP